MKNIVLTLLILALCSTAKATSVDSYSWSEICVGQVEPASWYGSTEAQQIADVVLAVQKTNGGWMKNDQLHNLSTADYNRLVRERGTHSCLDNYATTQEMRYLARVYAATGVAKYKTAFQSGIDLILAAQHAGGWSQYWPLTNDGGYQDYITFNDDLMTNVMLMLRDIYEGQGDFASITDTATRLRCQQAFDRGLTCILDCQIDIDGTLSAWCAQHDTVAPYYPMEGRPHELPSISGYESANLLSFLMTIENPSARLWRSIEAAVSWLDNHKFANRAVQDYTNAAGQPDRRMVTSSGSYLWGRFIQIGGQSGQAIYQHFFQKLQARGKTRSYTYNGTKYTYSEYEIATSAYDPAKANKPIFAIYKDTLQHMYYRFLYDYAPQTIAPTNVVGAGVSYLPDGCKVYTTLMATNRASYQYLGSWPERVISTDYVRWHRKYPTEPLSPVEESECKMHSAKCIVGGRIVIKRGEKTYDATGQVL